MSIEIANKEVDHFYYDNAFADFPATSRAVQRASAFLAGLWTKIWWRWEVQNGEELAKLDDGIGRVLIGNHVSMLEPIIVDRYLSKRHQAPRVLYKSEFDKAGIATWAFARFGGIPLRRGLADRKAIRRSVKALKRGEQLLIYPEGTRVKDRKDSVVHGGFSLIAQMANAQVVPMGIYNAEYLISKKTHLPIPKKVILRVGEPLNLADMPGKSRREKLEAMERIGMKRCYELVDAIAADESRKKLN